MDLASLIRAVPDFPKPGILFRDITPLLRDPAGFAAVVDRLHARYRTAAIDVVAAIESRGFVLGAPLALRLGVGFVPVRKAGKLPAATRSRSYALEYGTATLQVHQDALEPGQSVLIVDDLLATGGTARAAAELVEECGARVHEVVCLIELVELHGRAQLGDRAVHTLLAF